MTESKYGIVEAVQNANRRRRRSVTIGSSIAAVAIALWLWADYATVRDTKELRRKVQETSQLHRLIETDSEVTVEQVLSQWRDITQLPGFSYNPDPQVRTFVNIANLEGRLGNVEGMIQAYQSGLRVFEKVRAQIDVTGDSISDYLPRTGTYEDDLHLGLAAGFDHLAAKGGDRREEYALRTYQNLLKAILIADKQKKRGPNGDIRIINAAAKSLLNHARYNGAIDFFNKAAKDLSLKERVVVEGHVKRYAELLGTQDAQERAQLMYAPQSK